jgi:hypothetical protein
MVLVLCRLLRLCIRLSRLVRGIELSMLQSSWRVMVEAYCQRGYNNERVVG